MHPVIEISPKAPTTLAETCDRWLGPAMFWLSVAFLVLAAGVLHRMREGYSTAVEFQLISWAILFIWPLFLAEGGLRVLACVRPDGLPQRLLALAALVLAPPLRMGSRGYADGTKMWLPVWGWCQADRHLRKRLQTFFSVPMMAIAILVLPVLAMEYIWDEEVRAHFAASLFLDIASSVIWMAFAAEFILMVSVADKKLRYCMQNWMDVTIVALPVLDFIPILGLFRLTRLMSLQRLSRLYRLRGLMIKLWRAILLLDVVYRLIGNRREKRLLRLRELLATKLDEVTDLKKEIEDLERDVAACQVKVEQALSTATVAAPPSPALVNDETAAITTCAANDRSAGE